MQKKRIGYLLYIMIVLGICLLPLLAMGIRPDVGNRENRTPAPWPSLYKEDGFNWAYLQEAGDYFTDHFAFRQELVSADARIRTELFAVSPVDSVIVGKDGWLYYAATLDDYQHKDSVSERMLFNMAHNLALMQEYTQLLGKTFLFTVAPNKNSLYGDSMPDRLNYRLGDNSDMERLKPWLEREKVNYVDLYELFRSRDEVLYYARDSHWNQKGAVLVCNALLDAAGREHETYEEIAFEKTTDYLGDLNLMLFPVTARPEEQIRYQKEFTWEYSQGDDVEDNFIQTTCENGNGSLLLYRDSFGNSMLPYLAEEFRTAAFSKQVPYPMTDLVTYDPDLVIVERVERHLPTLGRIPPLMSGLSRSLQEEKTVVDSAATLRFSKEGSYWKMEGLADAAYMKTDSPIYLEVEDAAGVKTYEAFCVALSDEGTQDYGYQMYLSEILLEGDTFRIRVMTQKDDRLLVLHEEEIRTGDERKD